MGISYEQSDPNTQKFPLTIDFTETACRLVGVCSWRLRVIASALGRGAQLERLVTTSRLEFRLVLVGDFAFKISHSITTQIWETFCGTFCVCVCLYLLMWVCIYTINK
jgi:hypothetical protein